MAAIFWDNEYSVKIELIDDQHKKLFGYINEFYNNIVAGLNTDGVLKIIDSMKKYTVIHFSTEERLMKQYNFPGFAEHKKEHDDFVKKVHVLEEKIKNGTTIVSFEITNFLRDWIKKHINDTDKKYSEFFIKHGLK